MSYKIISKEDYDEPCCPFTKPGTVKTIPVSRVISKLDEHLNRNDYASAERHLKYWLGEAELLRDKRGKLTVLNECIGLYRKLSREEESLSSAEAALALAKELGLENTIGMGTTLVNAATAFKAFGKYETALPLYKEAQKLYESLLRPDAPKLGGLYNNMALAVMDTGDFRAAEELFNKALEIMAQNKDGEADMAVSWCNLADLAAREHGTMDGEARINECLDKAMELLDSDKLPHDGYYAFVCDKCAPTFSYYGFFLAAQDLRQRAKEIYERS